MPEHDRHFSHLYQIFIATNEQSHSTNAYILSHCYPLLSLASLAAFLR